MLNFFFTPWQKRKSRAEKIIQWALATKKKKITYLAETTHTAHLSHALYFVTHREPVGKGDVTSFNIWKKTCCIFIGWDFFLSFLLFFFFLLVSVVCFLVVCIVFCSFLFVWFSCFFKIAQSLKFEIRLFWYMYTLELEAKAASTDWSETVGLGRQLCFLLCLSVFVWRW